MAASRSTKQRTWLLVSVAAGLLAALGWLFLLPAGDAVDAGPSQQPAPPEGGGPRRHVPEVAPERVLAGRRTSLRGRIVTDAPVELSGGRVLLRRSPPPAERSFTGLFLTLIEGGFENLERNLERTFTSAPVLATTPLAADGTFLFPDAPAESVELDLAHERLRLVRRTVVMLAEGQPHDAGTIRAEPHGSLLVRVLGPAARPIAGASLELAHGVDGMPLDDESFWSDMASILRLVVPWKGVTHHDGSYLFPRLPRRRSWQLLTSADGYVRRLEVVSVPSREQGLHVVRLREGAGLRVQVTDPEGHAVAGARVVITFARRGASPPAGRASLLAPPSADSQPLRVQLETDGGGSASTSELAAGRVEIRVTHPGHLPHRTDVVVATGEARRVAIELERGLEISGRVLDAHAAPVAGAWVSRLRGFAHEIMGFDVVSFIGEELVALGVRDEGVRTDENGFFVLGGIERDAEVHLMAGAQGFLPARLGPVRAGSTDHVMRLERCANIVGVVVDAENGTPVSDFDARCTRVSWFVFDRPLARARIRGSQDGRFMLEGLPRGRMTLRVRTEDHAIFEQTISVASPELDVGEIRLEPPAAVEGVTLDPEGRALTGVRVWTAQGGMGDSSFVRAITGRATATSDREGRFRLPVPAKRLRLMAQKSGYAPTRSPSVQVRPGQVVKGVEITLERGGSLHGVVVDSAGAPLADWNIQASSANSVSIRFARSDDSGEFALAGLVAGQYLVDAFPDGVTAPAWMRRRDRGDIATIIKDITEHMVRERVQIRAGQQAEVRLVWAGRGVDSKHDLATLEGTVRVGAAPLAHGLVELVELGGGANTRYAEITQGSFQFSALAPGTYRARIKPGVLSRYLGEPKVVRVRPGARHRVELTYPGGRLSGRVVYLEDERPAEGILVTLHAVAGPRRANPLADASFGDEAGVTDAGGRFAFDGLSAGRYEIYARDMNWAGVGGARGAGQLGGLVIRDGEQRGNLTVELTGGGQLEVVVRASGAGSSQGALVRLLTRNGLPLDLFGRTRTDATGQVTLRAVPAGTYRVGVDAPDAAPAISNPIEVTDGRRSRATLELAAGVRVHLTVTAEASKVRPGERVVYSVWAESGALLRAAVFALPAAREDGRIRQRVDLGALKPGNVRLRIESASCGILEEARCVPASGDGEWTRELGS